MDHQKEKVEEEITFFFVKSRYGCALSTIKLSSWTCDIITFISGGVRLLLKFITGCKLMADTSQFLTRQNHVY